MLLCSNSLVVTQHSSITKLEILSLSTLFLIFSNRFTEKVEVRCFYLVITRTAGQRIVVDNIRYGLSAPQNASCCWAAFSYWLVVTSDAVRLSTGLQYVHRLSHSTKMLLSSNCRCWPTGVLIISNRLLIISIFFFACRYPEHFITSLWLLYVAFPTPLNIHTAIIFSFFR